MCIRDSVYTLGRSGKENNMLLSDEQLKAIDATLYHIDRGGDITYHGPGQLVCYPILNLEEFQLGLKEYVLSLIHICSFSITKPSKSHMLIVSFIGFQNDTIHVSSKNQQLDIVLLSLIHI